MWRRTLTTSFVLLFVAGRIAAADPDVLHIGFVDSLLQESSAGERKLLGKEFSDLVRDMTGLKSVVLQGITPTTAARQLDKEKWHLGVFHGVEFAWIQAKHPRLRPLMVTSAAVSPARCVLVVKKDGSDGNIADLKGKGISLLQNLQCRLYMEKMTGNKRDYFTKVMETRAGDDALDAVLRGDVAGAIVDNATMKFYEGIQPGRFSKLKSVAESDPFPQAVIAYREGTLSDALLKRIKDGMFKVKDSDRGRESMEAFRISGFQSPPADFQKSLNDILVAYPSKEED